MKRSSRSILPSISVPSAPTEISGTIGSPKRIMSPSKRKRKRTPRFRSEKRREMSKINKLYNKVLYSSKKRTV